MNEGKYVQIGVTALRDPRTGEFLPSVPMYVREEDLKQAAVMPIGEDNIAGILARKFEAYRNACAEAGVEI